MAEAGNIRQALLVGGRWLGPVGDNRHHGGAVTGADLPEMKVGDAIAAGFQALSDRLLHRRVGGDVEQHRPGIPDQTVGPSRDDKAADDAEPAGWHG